MEKSVYIDIDEFPDWEVLDCAVDIVRQQQGKKPNEILQRHINELRALLIKPMVGGDENTLPPSTAATIATMDDLRAYVAKQRGGS